MTTEGTPARIDLSPACWRLHLRVWNQGWDGQNRLVELLFPCSSSDEAQGLYADYHQQNEQQGGQPFDHAEFLAPGQLPVLGQPEMWHLHIEFTHPTTLIFGPDVQQWLLEPHASLGGAQMAFQQYQRFLMALAGRLNYAAFIPPNSTGADRIVEVPRR